MYSRYRTATTKRHFWSAPSHMRFWLSPLWPLLCPTFILGLLVQQPLPLLVPHKVFGIFPVKCCDICATKVCTTDKINHFMQEVSILRKNFKKSDGFYATDSVLFSRNFFLIKLSAKKYSSKIWASFLLFKLLWRCCLLNQTRLISSGLSACFVCFPLCSQYRFVDRSHRFRIGTGQR